MMNTYLKKSELTTQEFEPYLSSIPSDYRKTRFSGIMGGSTVSLKPQLVKKCYESIEKEYFDYHFSIRGDFFSRSKKVGREKQVRLYEDLDEVEICLFNQITSRFDEILSVLRTIESLEMIVEDNQSKLRNIRQRNLLVSKRVAAKQCNVLRIIRKKKRLELAMDVLRKLKYYSQHSDLTKNSKSCKEKPSKSLTRPLIIPPFNNSRTMLPSIRNSTAFGASMAKLKNMTDR